METASKNLALLEHKASLYEQLIHIDPNDPKYLKRYAEILLQLGRKVEADRVLNRLQKLAKDYGDPEQERALTQLRREIVAHEQPSLSASVFHFSNSKAMQLLIARAKRRCVNEGEYYIRQGEASEGMAIILDGEMAVLARYDKESQPVLIHVLTEGDIVGEMAFLQGAERSADVVASKETTLLELRPKHVLKCLLEYPEVEEALLRETAIRRHIIDLSRNPLLARLPRDLRRWLGEAAEDRRYPAFKVVWRAGEKPDAVGIVTAGLLRFVTEDRHGNSHILEPLKPGDLLGENTAVSNEPVMADMVAVTDTDIVAFPLQVFRDVIRIHPPFREELIRKAADRIASTMILIRDKADLP